MDLKGKILTLLAIFCVIASAGVVCAADADSGDVFGTQDVDQDVYSESQNVDGYAGSQYEDGGYAGSQYQDDGGWAGCQYNETLEAAYGAGEPANATGNTTANVTAAAGEPVNATGNSTVSHKMLETGNPILALLAVSAVLGGYTVIRRK